MYKMTEGQTCESCGYAVWFSDYSVGIDDYVDSCKAKFPSAEKQFERCRDDDNYQCPFHIKRYPDYSQYTRCTACNSPNTKFVEMYDEVNDIAKYRCEDCKEIFKADVSWR